MKDRSSYPDSAFGLVKGNFKMLLHHNPENVKDGNESDSIDIGLLDTALSFVDFIPASKEEIDLVKSHLIKHKVEYLLKAEAAYDIYEERLKNYHVFCAGLDGVQETPSVTTTASGHGKFAYNSKTKELWYYICYDKLSSDESGAHFHIGEMGKPGEIIIGLTSGQYKTGMVLLTEPQELALLHGNMYVNIHSKNYPEGEIRGQLFPTSVVDNAPRLRVSTCSDSVIAATWTTAFINNLPDSSFAVIEKGGKKDEDGRTVPRSYRHLPYKDADGKVDLPHLRNALARMNQIQAVSPEDSTERIRKAAMEKLSKVAHEELPNSKFAESEILGASAKLHDVKMDGQKHLVTLLVGDDEEHMCEMPIDVSYDAEMKPISIKMYDTMIPMEHMEGLVTFLDNMLGQWKDKQPKEAVYSIKNDKDQNIDDVNQSKEKEEVKENV